MRFNRKRFHKKLNNFMFDHYVLREVLSNAWTWAVGLVAAAVFAFGFTCFTTPASSDGFTIVTGGVSGLSQDLALTLNIFGIVLGKNILQAIGYLGINLPIIIFAFFKLTKRFAIHTFLNVAETSLLIILFSSSGFTDAIRSNAFITSSILTRVLASAVCTGVSSALAFTVDISCGGIDVFSYFLSMKKSTTVGKYAIIINAFIVGVYAVLLSINSPEEWTNSIVSILYSTLYLFVCALVIDFINVRNKKVQIKGITTNENMPQILISQFPHAATVSKGKGAYSGADRFIITMVVSSNEAKRVVSVIKRADEHAFIEVTPLIQVYGNFFTKPIQ